MAPHSSEKPTFLLLRARLPATYATKLLGRFVTHPSRPLDNSEPKDPLQIIKIDPVEIEEKSASIELSTIQNTTAQAKVRGLIDLGASGNQARDTGIQNTTVKTYRLQDHYKAFDNLLEDLELKKSLDGPKGLMARSSGTLYMVVGIKTCSSGTVFNSNNHGGAGLVSKLTVPISEAFGTFPTSLDPEFGISSSAKHSNKEGFETVGEQVFAVEYKKVKQKNIFGFQSATAEPKVAHDVKTQEWGNAVFNGEKGNGLEEKDDDGAAFDDELNERLAKEDELGEVTGGDYIEPILQLEDVNEFAEKTGEGDFVFI